MAYVLLCSNKKDSRLAKCILSALEKNGGVQSTCPNNIFSTTDSPNYFFTLTESMPNVKNINGVMVFDSHFKYCNPNSYSNCLVPIIGAQNRKAASQLKHITNPVITCGTNQQDTFSLASINSNHATISLQRKLTDINGNIYEPMDISINMETENGVYPTLACCAILLLCGCDPTNGYKI